MKFTSLAIAFAAIGTQAVRIETLVETEVDPATAAIYCCTCAIFAKDVIEVGEKVHHYIEKYKEKCHHLPKDEHGNEIHEIAQVERDMEA